MSSLTNVTIPMTLRDLLAERAGDETIEHTLDAALLRQLAHVDELGSAGERLADFYLGHPRLASVTGGRPIRVLGTTLAQLDQVADKMSTEIGRNVPRGRVMQALVWAEFMPISADERQPPPAVDNRDRQSSNVPRSLYDALQARSLRMGNGRLITETVDALLERATPDVPVATYQTALHSHPARDNDVVVVRYSRTYERVLAEVAQEGFAGVKGRAVQALLWYALDLPIQEAPKALPDHQLLLSGELYTQAMDVLTEERKRTGQTKSVRAFVEEAVNEKIEREQHGRRRKGS